MNLLPNIDQIYDEYLHTFDQEKSTHFRVSSAGYCYKKQIYSISDIESTPFDQRTLRLFRLGTLIHEDIQEALKRKYPAAQIEEELDIEKWNVKGHYDFMINENGTCYLGDIKTIASYKWSKQFGREKNRDKNPAVNYELQIGTYAYGLQELHDITAIMFFYWYKKDNSQTKASQVPDTWVDKAIDYWEDFTEVRKEINLLEVAKDSMPNVPVYEWECRYCQYNNECTRR